MNTGVVKTTTNNDVLTLLLMIMKNINPTIQVGVQLYETNIHKENFPEYNHNVKEMLNRICLEIYEIRQSVE